MNSLFRLFCLLGITALLVFGFYFWVNRAKLLSDFLSNKLEMNVKIHDAEVGLSSLTLSNIQIRSRPGAYKKISLNADTLKITVSPYRLFKQVIDIKEVSIQNVHLQTEFYIKNSLKQNLSLLLNHAMDWKFSSPKDLSNQRKFIIRSLKISNADIKILNTFNEEDSVGIPTISRLELRNIGSDRPAGFQQILEILFKALLEKVNPVPPVDSFIDRIKKESKDVLYKIASPFLKEKRA